MLRRKLFHSRLCHLSKHHGNHMILGNLLYYLPNFFFVCVVLVSRRFLSMTKACFGNLVMGILLSLNQYLREEIVLSIYRGYLPVSPYTLWFGVLSLTLNNLLQAKRSAVSIFASLEVPQTSEAYKSIGLIWASKSWKHTVVSKLPGDHIVLIKSTFFPLALLAKSSQAQTLDNFVVRVYPKYLYVLTISISFPYKNNFSPAAMWPHFLKTITFVLSKFTVRPKDLDAFSRLFIWFGNPDGVEDTKTVSSANRQL